GVDDEPHAFALGLEAVGELRGHRNGHRRRATHAFGDLRERRRQAMALAPQRKGALDDGGRTQVVLDAGDLDVRTADVPAEDRHVGRLHAALRAAARRDTMRPAEVNRIERRTRGVGGRSPAHAASASSATFSSTAARTPRYAVVRRGFTSMTNTS